MAKITGITKPSQQSARWMSCRSSLKPPMLKTAFAGPDAAGRGYVPTLTGYTPHASWPNCCFPTGGGESPADLYRLRSTQHRAHRRRSTASSGCVTTTPPALLPCGATPRARATVVWRKSRNMLVSLPVRPRLLTLSRSQLDEVGLTSRDIILFNQIIGFVGFRARAIAVLQAAGAFRCAGSPVCPSKRHPRAVRPAAGSMAGRHCGSRPAVCR